MDKYVTYAPAQCAKKGNASIAGITAALVLLGSMSTAQAIDTATADLNDNGRVDIFDLRMILSRRNVEAGILGYMEHLDLNADGIIDRDDYTEVRSKYRQSGIATSPTSLSGRIRDRFSHQLEGVKVFVGPPPGVDFLSSPCIPPLCVTTDAAGDYTLNIPAGSTGVTTISFVGNAVIDPSPSVLSGQFVTIPGMPVFINGGVDSIFRDMVLPERNLNGSVDLTTFNATSNGGGSYTLNEPLTVKRSSSQVTIPSGCTLNFPDGEDPVVSMLAIPSNMLSLQMPPGLQSTIFRSIQPGHTTVNCGAGVKLLVEMENVDGYQITLPSTPLADRPLFAAVSDGVFKELTRCSTIDNDNNGIDFDVNDTVRCELDTPYVFGWNHPDKPNPECLRTTVVGRVELFGSNAPIPGATVRTNGASAVTTDATGAFSIPNTPAGPNGQFCTSRGFSTQVTATGPIGAGQIDSSVSRRVPAVTGGNTDVGIVLLGAPPGTVQGEALKLSRISPLLIDPVPGMNVGITDNLGSSHITATDSTGGYSFTSVVELGNYTGNASFSGNVTLPGFIDEDPTINGIDEDNDLSDGEDPVNGIDDDGDGLVSRTYNAVLTGSVTDPNIVSIRDINIIGEGTIVVTFNNVPMGFTFGRARSGGGTFGSTFVIQATSNFGPVDDAEDGGGLPSNSTTIVFTNVPLGPCKLSIVDDVNLMEREAYNESMGCFINEEGQVLTVEVDATNYAPSLPKDFSGAFTFFAIGSIGLTAVARRRRKT